MARSRKKHAAYRKICGIIGQPVAEFTDHIRKLMGENADSTARVVTFNPKTNQSYVVTVAAAAGGWGDRAGGNEEYLLTLTENHGYVHGAGGAGGSAAAAAAAATADGGQAAKGKKRTLFKGRVQLSPTASRPAPRGGGGNGGGRPSAGKPRRQARTLPGLSSIAGVCMLCAVASAGGIAFYASYMSQTADHGTINIIRAEVIDLDESMGGRLVDVELFASHTSCVMMYDRSLHTVLYEEGDGCRDTWRDPPPEADSYTTSTGVHVSLDDYRMQADDRKWMMLEIQTDTASIIHPVKVEGVR